MVINTNYPYGAAKAKKLREFTMLIANHVGDDYLEQAVNLYERANQLESEIRWQEIMNGEHDYT